MPGRKPRRLDRDAGKAYPSRMKSRLLVWLAAFLGVVLALSAIGLRGWGAVAVVAGTLVLAIPLSVKRFRQERNLARSFWRALTTR